MSPLGLREPDWDAIVGGNADDEKWLADRELKLGAAHSWADELIDVQRRLRIAGAEFRASPDVLESIPLAATWYISMLGFSLKTLGSIKTAWRTSGLNQNPKSFAASLRKGVRKNPAQLEAFSRWINSEIAQRWPADKQNSTAALAVASMIIGGRIIGAGQNTGGREAVNLVKSLFVNAIQTAGCTVEIKDGDKWKNEYTGAELAAADMLRFAGRIVCDVGLGGERPDIVLKTDEEVLAVGEIKGRKDVSNVWESWMPTIEAHLTSWEKEHPVADRLHFGTIVTQEMVNGGRIDGVQRKGLRELYEDGKLTGAFNVGKISSADSKARRSFDDLISKLCPQTQPDASSSVVAKVVGTSSEASS